MSLTELYIYFAQFVSHDVVERNFQQSASDQNLSQAVMLTWITLAESAGFREIEDLQDYLFLGDQDFVLERLRNSKDMLLFVDCDKIEYTPDSEHAMRMSLAVTVAKHYNQSNASVVGELCAQNDCLEVLKRILRQMKEDSDSRELGCGTPCLMAEPPYDLRFFDAKQLNGLIGYTAFLTIEACEFNS